MVDRAIIKAVSIGLFVFAWTHFAITDNPKVFYPVLACACFVFYLPWQLTIRHKTLDRKVNIVGFLFTFSNLLDEFVFDPTKVQANEYVFALLTVYLVTISRKHEHKQRQYITRAKRAINAIFCKIVGKIRIRYYANVFYVFMAVYCHPVRSIRKGKSRLAKQIR